MYKMKKKIILFNNGTFPIGFIANLKKNFKNLVKPYFSIVDIGFSSHKLFRRTITEFIICGIK